MRIARFLTTRREDRTRARDRQATSTFKYRQLLTEIVRLRQRKANLKQEVCVCVCAYFDVLV